MVNENRMVTSKQLSGTLVALVTPFEEFSLKIKPEVNQAAFVKIIDYVAPHVGGIVLTASTGSHSYFINNAQSQIDTINFAASYIRSRYPGKLIIAGDWSSDIWEAIERVKRIEGETGVNIHLSMSPGESKPSDESIFRHFYELADNTEGYFIPYSIPSRSGGKGILSRIVKRLAKHPRIIGLKDCSGRTEEIARLTKRLDFAVLSGDDSSAVEDIRLGARGLISTLGNLAPSKINEMISLSLQKKYEQARKISENFAKSGIYLSLFPKLENRNPANNPATTQYAMNILGFDVGRTPTQLAECSRAEKRGIRRSIYKLKISNCLERRY